MTWEILFSLPGLLLIGALFLGIVKVKQIIEDKNIEKRSKEQDDRIMRQVKEELAQQKRKFFEDYPDKTIDDYRKFSSEVYEKKRKALLDKHSDESQIEVKVKNSPPVEEKKKVQPIITKAEWEQAPFLQKIWIVLVIGGLLSLLLLYFKEIILFIAVIVVTILLVIVIIVFSSFLH